MGPIKSSFRFLRSYFIYGLLVLLPIVATAFILTVIFNMITAPFEGIVGEQFSGLLLLVLSLGVITLVGFFSRNFIGQFLVDLVESFISKLPLLNKVYDSVKQIVVAFSLRKKKALKPVLLEYPRKGVWAMGFLTFTTMKELGTLGAGVLPSDAVSVFVPTTPNPTSGYFVFVSEADVTPLELPFDEAVRLLISAGVIRPK